MYVTNNYCRAETAMACYKCFIDDTGRVMAGGTASLTFWP